MNVVYKFKDGFEFTMNAEQYKQNSNQADFLESLKTAQKNEEMIIMNTPGGVVERKYTDLKSVEIMFI